MYTMHNIQLLLWKLWTWVPHCVWEGQRTIAIDKRNIDDARCSHVIEVNVYSKRCHKVVLDA